MEIFEDTFVKKKGRVKVIIFQFHTTEITYHRMYEGPQKRPNLIFPTLFNAEELSGEKLVNNALENKLQISYLVRTIALEKDRWRVYSFTQGLIFKRKRKKETKKVDKSVLYEH